MTLNVDELRTQLMSNGFDGETVAKMNKKDLSKKYMEIMQKKLEDQIELTFEENSSTPPKSIEDAIQVTYGSPEWQKFILTQLTPDELLDGCPRCNGLRRVANAYLGKIVSSGAKDVFVSHSDTGRVITVNYEIVFDWIIDRNVGGYINLNNYETDRRTFCGLADCSEDQTMYGRHPAATAESKAESRALRKALMLNTVTAEEKITGADDEMPQSKKGARIPKPLKDVILAKAEKLNINLQEALENEKLPTNLDDLTAEQGRFVFDMIINKYQQRSS